MAYLKVSQSEMKNKFICTDICVKISSQLTHVLKTLPLRCGHATEGHTKLCKIPSLCQDALLHSYIKNGLCVAFVTLSRQVQPRDWCRIEETSATTSSWVGLYVKYHSSFFVQAANETTYTSKIRIREKGFFLV